MTCDEVQRLESGDAALRDDATRAAVEAHVRTCGRCREAREARAIVCSVLATRPPAPASAWFVERVMRRIGRDASWLNGVAWRTWTLRLSPVALVLFLLTLLAPAAGPRATTVRQRAATTEPVGVMEAWAVGAARPVTLPATALLWQPDVSADRLLVTVLTTSPDAALEESARGR